MPTLSSAPAKVRTTMLARWITVQQTRSLLLHGVWAQALKDHHGHYNTPYYMHQEGVMLEVAGSVKHTLSWLLPVYQANIK